MPDFITVEYGATGASKAINEFGMRAMQSRAFDARNSQYLLIKSPPASGKSRALMFLGLDKLRNQGMRKVIVAVPERSIGNSFRSTDLTKYGFFADWKVAPQNNLCDMIGGDTGKINSFVRFMESDDDIIICTHSTLRHAFDRIMREGQGISAFHDCVLAIDEFHHVSADADNRLGELIRTVMDEGSTHIVAMTGSYFRGDQVPVLRPEDEEKFTRVTYTYYEQLSGYEHLKTLGIGYHFYHGSYLTAIGEVLDTSDDVVRGAVNDMLKAIAASLLMEQVLAPNFNFKTKPSDDRFDGAARPCAFHSYGWRCDHEVLGDADLTTWTKNPAYPTNWPKGLADAPPPGTVPMTAAISRDADRRLAAIQNDLENAGPFYPREAVTAALRERGLTYHSKPTRWVGEDGLLSVARGQEFVCDVGDDSVAIAWAERIIDLIRS